MAALAWRAALSRRLGRGIQNPEFRIQKQEAGRGCGWCVRALSSLVIPESVARLLPRHPGRPRNTHSHSSLKAAQFQPSVIPKAAYYPSLVIPEGREADYPGSREDIGDSGVDGRGFWIPVLGPPAQDRGRSPGRNGERKNHAPAASESNHSIRGFRVFAWPG